MGHRMAIQHLSIDEVIQARFLLNQKNHSGDSFSLDVDIVIPKSGITAIFGHSGSGKTTLLRCIAGLEKAEQGQLTVNGEDWQSNSCFVATHKRPIGYVFQEASLFSHLNAEANLNYAIKRSMAAFDKTLYQRVIDIMGINAILKRYPSQLSGGERQRVAIARALLIQPKVLLMDEPLAALDSARKQEILPYLERLRTNFELPILYVSHSKDEVARLADHVVVLEQGKVMAQGELTQVFSRIDLPMHFEQDSGAIIKAQVVERDSKWHLMRVAFNGGELWLRDSGEEIEQQVRIRVLARDVSLTLTCQRDSSIQNKLPVEVVEIVDDEDQAMSLIRLKLGNEFIIARITRRSVALLQLAIGNKIWAQIKSVAIVH